MRAVVVTALILALAGCHHAVAHPKISSVTFKHCRVIERTGSDANCECAHAQWHMDVKVGWIAECLPTEEKK